jgi:hypothetical protein
MLTLIGSATAVIRRGKDVGVTSCEARHSAAGAAQSGSDDDSACKLYRESCHCGGHHRVREAETD